MIDCFIQIHKHFVTGETQRKNGTEQHSLSCVLTFMAPVQTVCGRLTLAGCHVPTQPLSHSFDHKRGGNKMEKFVGRDKDRGIT